MLGVAARIFLRVLAGIMIGYGLPPDWARELTHDPDALITAELVVGGLLWAGTEVAYWMALKFGWRT